MARLKPNQLDFNNIKLEIVIYGTPCVGKTTLAESAKRVLLVDADNGIYRISSAHRKEIIDIGNKTGQAALDVIREDLSGDLSDIDAIAIDTTGAILEYLKTAILSSNNSKAKQADGTLTQSGWGILGTKFEEFRKFLLSLNKHIIWLCHSTEVKDGNDDAKTRVRIDLQGATKNNIFKGATLVGYMEYQGKDRVIHFKPNERYYAKGSHGILPTYKLPVLSGNNPNENTFLGDLIDFYLSNLNDDMNKYGTDLEIYNEAMNLAVDVNEVKNVEELNLIVDQIKNTQHALTSKQELLAHVQNKAKELGATYDKESKRYITGA